MKFKYYFALILLLAIALSLGTTVASENIDCNASSTDAHSSVSVESQFPVLEDSGDNLIGEGSSSNDEVDVSVDMELGDIKRETFAINQMTFEIPLIVTVSVDNGTAHNVKAYLNIPDDFKLLSSDATIGKYDEVTGIWDIGELDSASNATLTILTKLEKSGKYIITVNATTDSNDTDFSNNDIICTITADTRISSNTTRTSANQGGANHGPRGATRGPGVVKRDDETPTNQNSGGGSNTNNNGGENNNNNNNNNNGENNNNNGENNNNNGENNNNNNNEENNNNNNEENNNNNEETEENEEILTKTTRSLTSAISDALASLLNMNSNSDSELNLTPDVVKAIAAQDYIKIPILIFALFLICTLGVAVHGKIKT